MPLFAGSNAPVRFRRAFFAFCGLAAATTFSPMFAANVPVKPPELSQAGKASPEEAKEILEQFRRSGIRGEYYLEFDLHALPRRGEEQIFSGRWWGSRNAQGMITRVELTDAKGQKHRLLIQNGEKATVWKFAEGKVKALGVPELFQPLIAGVEITAFDVQMPFLYWPDATLEKITRTRTGSRPTNAFLFRAPAAFASQHGEVVAARAYLDMQFNALLQTELLGKNNRVVKTFSLLNFKTVNQQPLPKAADYRNEITRDKTRIAFTAAAIDQKLAPAIFTPESLVRDAETPPRNHIVSLD